MIDDQRSSSSFGNHFALLSGDPMPAAIQRYKIFDYLHVGEDDYLNLLAMMSRAMTMPSRYF